MADGTKYVGEVKDDKPWNGIGYDANGKIVGTSSAGKWCSNCSPNKGQLALVDEITNAADADSRKKIIPKSDSRKKIIPKSEQVRRSCDSAGLSSSERLYCYKRWRKKCLNQYSILYSMSDTETASQFMRLCMESGGYSSSRSKSKSACTGPYCSRRQAWDYLPGSDQWRCRDTGGHRGGEFVKSRRCSNQRMVDNWP